MDKLDEFTRAYLVTALWSSSDGEGNSLARYHSLDQLTPALVARAELDCSRFQAEDCAGMLLRAAYRTGYTQTSAGHDFWLTRNRHGAGYWCRDEIHPMVADCLTDMAHQFSDVDLYVSDDNLIDCV